MAYVVVVHMTPKQPSMMPALLQKATRIPVTAARDGQSIKPDHAYVIPPDKELSVYKGKIQLLDSLPKTTVLPIDFFLRSLAIDQGSDAAGIILSGTGSDGTLGVREIKSNDGIVLAQSLDSAEYDGMPNSVINAGLADLVLPPEKMPAKLVQYFRHRIAFSGLEVAKAVNQDQQVWLSKIFALLRTQVGHDFSGYKVNTILRRISRRMGLNQIDNHENYIRLLRETPGEVDALFRELLIGVTSFFRDAESFDALKSEFLPDMFARLPDGATFRAWIPGCSTGEEVYSLAITMRECLDRLSKRVELQLFGTDIDNYAIDSAREGLFPVSIKADVNAERLKRFFIKEGEWFRVRKEIRDCAVFSVQDIIKDPPFSRLDMLCCRNLLIYLDAAAQKKILPLFHYTLKPDGVLVLGSSETIGSFTSLFKALDKKWKIYRRMEVPKTLHQYVDFPNGSPSIESSVKPVPDNTGEQKVDLGQTTRQAILEQFSPTAILIDTKGNILHIQGRTGRYLESTSGPPTQNILNLAREGLRIELAAAIRTAKDSDRPVVHKRVTVQTDGKSMKVDLHVSPLKTPKEIAGRLLVVFKDIEPDLARPNTTTTEHDPEQNKTSRIADLERELQITREDHQTTIEELESSNEELKSTNEEM